MTRKLLDVLNSRGAVATFFVIGHKVDALRDDVGAITRSGHEVGSHSYHHLHAWKRNPVSVYHDIRDGFRALQSFGACRLFRAPYGKMTLGTMLQVSMQGYRQSWWTIDSTDTWATPRAVGLILDQVRCEGGGVVLLHDMDRPGHPEHEAFVLELTRALLDLAETEKFGICTLGEVLKA